MKCVAAPLLKSNAERCRVTGSLLPLRDTDVIVNGDQSPVLSIG
jgi:hypothetical protein